MHFHQVLNDELGCASYLLADGGEAVVVDPRWDVDVYVELATKAGARITHVVETHDHADHVSGRGRLARRTGAQMHRPYRDGDPSAQLRAGDVLRAGRVHLKVIATPGHRPEHISLLVSDGGRDDHAWCLLAGDSLLVGDVARPDLAVAAQDGARDLHASIQRILGLGDHVELWPAHVGGSLCGGGCLSAKTSSTIGFERRVQTATGLTAADFVAAIATRTPPKPPNIARIVALNQSQLDAEPAPPVLLDAAGLRRVAERGATVIDVRPPAEFDAAHLSGALAFGAGANRPTRVGWTVEPDEPLVIVAADVAEAERFATALHAVGLWSIEGIAVADPAGWRAAGCALVATPAWSVGQLADATGSDEVTLIDVRDRSEYDAGHVHGALHIPLNVLGDGRRRLPVSPGQRLVVACARGPRAALGASLLRRAGHADVVHVAGGGIPDLEDRGVALERRRRGARAGRLMRMSTRTPVAVEPLAREFDGAIAGAVDTVTHAGELARAIPVADVADATPLNALLLEEMPLGAHFRRDHFPVPELEPTGWTLEVGGAVRRPLRLDVDALRRLGAQTERVVLECAGHRRSEYQPAVPGLTWAEGAVGGGALDRRPAGRDPRTRRRAAGRARRGARGC